MVHSFSSNPNLVYSYITSTRSHYVYTYIWLCGTHKNPSQFFNNNNIDITGTRLCNVKGKSHYDVCPYAHSMYIDFYCKHLSRMRRTNNCKDRTDTPP